MMRVFVAVHNKVKNIFWLLSFFAGVELASGQNIVFNHLAVENGLSNNSVLAIAQDARGFMWYGTSNGLNRYDGYSFRIYKANPADSASISNNNILCLLSDSKQNLWIGTSDGLNKYNFRKDAFEKVNLPKSKSNIINCMMEDRKGNIWIGTNNGLYMLKDNEINNLQSFYYSDLEKSIANNNIRSIFEDSGGKLWIATANGLTKMDRINDRYNFETFHYDPVGSNNLSTNYITAITEDRLQNLWIGTQNNGITRYNPATNSFIHFTHGNIGSSGIINNNIRKLIVDKKGMLWIGTQEGLSILNPANSSIYSYQHDAGNRKSLSQNSIHSLFEDANGSVWVGSYFGGVNITHSSATNFNTYQNNESISSLSNNVVSSIVEDKYHNLWIGTEGGGLNYLNRSNGLFTIYRNKQNDASSLGSNLVKVVYLDADENLWLGTHGGGLNVFDPNEKKFKRFLYQENDPATLNSEVISLLEDHSGRFWVVTNSGLKLFRRKGTVLEPLEMNHTENPFLNIPARTMFEDSKHNVWIGGTPGLFKISGNRIKTVDTNYIVNCIAEDAKGNIWAGLRNSGLGMYNEKNGKLINYAGQGSLLETDVVGLVTDDKDNLWLSTDNGLIKLDASRNHFQTYTISDGLAGNEFNYNSFLKDSKGEFFFGGFNGITSFFPGAIETNDHKAPIVFTGLKLFNKVVEIGGVDNLLKENIALAKKITFPYNQNVFTIEFALLNYIKSDKNKYAYKLEGFDKNWNEVNNTFATYTNLPSGNYTFLVKGANNDGVWSLPAALKIKVLPPFWLTWGAYFLYALLLAGILFLITRFFFLKALLKKEDELHQVKLIFFTNISHEIRTHLTLIMAPVEKMLGAKENDYQIHQQLTTVKNNANRLLKLVNEILDFRKAETEHLQLQVARHNLIPFLEEIYTSFRELSLAKNITISFIHNREYALLYFDKEQLEKVFFNLLSNAFKFTPEGGRINMSIEQKEKVIQIKVIDNGRGIAPQYLDKLFTNFFQVADHGLQNTGYGIGLALTKHIVELHKGAISVESKAADPGREGFTCFTVTLLQGNKHFEGSYYLQNVEQPENKKLTVPETQEKITPFELPSDEHKNKSLSILIAEDNTELRLLLRDTFIAHYNVLECEHGLQGWETATEQIPDLIISDVMMPEMDGFILCEKLKTDERTSHIPVILLTAKSSQSEQVSGLETGADVYITKPFSSKALELNVRNLLASRESMRQKFSRRIIDEVQNDLIEIESVENDFVNTIDKEFLNKLIQLIEENMDNPEFGVEMLSRKVAMSQPVLYKKIKAVTNLTVNDFVKSFRLKKAAVLLQQKKLAVYEVAYAVGFNDRKYFSKEFKKQFGKTPSEFSNAE